MLQVKVQVEELEVGHRLTKGGHRTSVYVVIVFVRLVEDQVEVAKDRPRSQASVSNSLQLLQEEALLCFSLWAIDDGEPPRGKFITVRVDRDGNGVATDVDVGESNIRPPSRDYCANRLTRSVREEGEASPATVEGAAGGVVQRTSSSMHPPGGVVVGEGRGGVRRTSSSTQEPSTPVTGKAGGVHRHAGGHARRPAAK